MSSDDALLWHSSETCKPPRDLQADRRFCFSSRSFVRVWEGGERGDSVFVPDSGSTVPFLRSSSGGKSGSSGHPHPSSSVSLPTAAAVVEGVGPHFCAHAADTNSCVSCHDVIGNREGRQETHHLLPKRTCGCCSQRIQHTHRVLSSHRSVRGLARDPFQLQDQKSKKKKTKNKKQKNAKRFLLLVACCCRSSSSSSSPTAQHLKNCPRLLKKFKNANSLHYKQ